MSDDRLDLKGASGGAVGEEIAELGYSPSGRDRAIYEAICVANRPAAEVGREFDLAATTVRNIAHETQRKLARRQHEFDRRGSAEALAGYFTEFKSQVDQLYRAWEASCEPADRVQRLITRTGRPECRPGEESVAPRPTCQQVVEKEVPFYRPARPDVRCMALANRIVRDMLALEEQYKEAKAREGEQSRRGEIPGGTPTPPTSTAPAAPVQAAPVQAAPVQAAPALTATLLARDEVELQEIRALLPPLAPGQTREFTRAGNGAWQVRERPPRPKPMSRRQRHLLAQGRELERGGGGEHGPGQTTAVSAAPQALDGQRDAESHLRGGSGQ